MNTQTMRPIEAKFDQTMWLPDGRVLGYAEFGNPGGFPVFHFHGGNSSRLEGKWVAEAAVSGNIRLIAPDRPGFGLSDPQPGRSILSWAADIAQLADALEIDRFAVMGLSGGGPYVAGVAHQLAQRVTAAALVSSVAPPEMPGWLKGIFLPLRLNFLAARYAPPLSRWFLQQMSGSYADSEKFLQMVRRGMPKPDRELAERRPEVIYQFSAAAVESHRQGTDGDYTEWQLYVRPWGFPLAAITIPVRLWYGEADNFAPPAMGRYLASKIPNSDLRLVPDGGHFSTINNYAEAILAGLLEAGSA